MRKHYIKASKYLDSSILELGLGLPIVVLSYATAYLNKITLLDFSNQLLTVSTLLRCAFLSIPPGYTQNNNGALVVMGSRSRGMHKM
jgi:hypothetical protein